MTKAVDKTIGHALILAARLHRLRAAQLYASIGLFPGQESVIATLANRGEMAMGDLAAALHVRPPTISKTIARLAAQDLVHRLSGSADGRVVRVGLTESGLKIAALIGERAEMLESELTAALDGKDRKRLRKLLRRSATALAKSAGSTHAPDVDPEDSSSDLDE
jgi:DNA-binding MarR family transcriptional regulator